VARSGFRDDDHERTGQVQRDESYWDERPVLDKGTFRFYPDDTTRARRCRTARSTSSRRAAGDSGWCGATWGVVPHG